MYGLRDSYEIVQRQIEKEQEAFQQNENAMLFYNATEDILRNEKLPRIVQCPKCDGYVELENDGRVWTGECECGNDLAYDEEEIDERTVEV